MPITMQTDTCKCILCIIHFYTYFVILFIASKRVDIIKHNADLFAIVFKLINDL